MSWYRIIAFCTLFYISKVTHANMPTSSGYYEVDSLYIEIDWPTSEHEVIEFRLNSFSKHDYNIYQNGFWIYDQSFSENSWENKVYMDYDCIFPVNEDQERGELYKANVLSVRTRNIDTDEITKDSIYIYALYENPFQHFTFFATIDDEDREELMSSFRDEKKLKKRAWLTVFNKNGELEVSQPVMMKLAGNASLCIANKGVSFKAKDSEPYNGLKRFNTSLWSADHQRQDFKKIKLRSGGGGQSDAFGSNEIILKTLSTENFPYQNVKNTTASWFLNGSFWSLTFPQEKINDWTLSEALKTSRKEIDILEPIALNFQIDTSKTVCSPYDFFDFNLQIDSVQNQLHCEQDSCYIRFKWQGNKEWEMMPANFTHKDFPLVIEDSGIYSYMGRLKEGKGTFIKTYLNAIQKAINSSKVHSINELNTLLDLDNFLKYISTIDFLNLHDIIYNNAYIVATEDKLPFVVFWDFDMNLVDESNVNGGKWDLLDIETNTQCLGILHSIIKNMILKSPEARERLQLVYQDLLNTNFIPENGIKQVKQVRESIIPNFQYHYDSWGGKGNGGLLDSLQLEEYYALFKSFFEERPKVSLEKMADKFQPEMNYVFEDRNLIQLNFDSIPEGVVKVKLNSLEITDNFDGYYLPSPALQIEYEVEDGYEVEIKELPQSDSRFNLPLNQEQTLTFVLKNKVPVNIKESI